MGPRKGILAGQNHSVAFAALKACFGNDGDFTVIVEEPAGDTSEDARVEAEAERTEFKAWSSMLCHYSPVFATMIGSDIYQESQKAEVVISDFSASAVEMFLRFLYTGSVRGSASDLLEVAAMADKYEVQALHTLCMQTVREGLKPEVACEIFASADRFLIEDLRSEALDLIFTKPEEALAQRPALRPELLEEILGSGLLCMSADAMKRTLQNWGEKEDSLASIVKAHIPSTPVRSVHLRGELTKNSLQSLWKCYCDAGKKGTFLGYCVNVLLGPGQSEICTQDRLLSMASGSENDKFTFHKGWVQWHLPYCSVHLQGFSFGRFGQKKQPSASFRINVKSDEDGATWHLAHESQKTQIKSGTFLACKRPPGLVKYFKLEVLEGELVNVCFNIHGILQTSV